MSKYYKPDIEEFHIGFEAEEWNTSKQEFKRCVCKKPHDINRLVVKLKAVGMRGVGWMVRVKYLDAQDILDLGFELVNEIDDNGDTSFQYITNTDWWLTFDNKKVTIGDIDGISFHGIVKNKSELKRVIKQICYENSIST